MKKQDLKIIRDCFATMAAVSNKYPELRESLEPGLEKLNDVLVDEHHETILKSELDISSIDLNKLSAANIDITQVYNINKELYYPLQAASTLITNIVVEARLKIKSNK